jgi:hypothetical protein
MITSVDMGRPRRNPIVQQQKVMVPSQFFRVEGLIATRPCKEEFVHDG